MEKRKRLRVDKTTYARLEEKAKAVGQNVDEYVSELILVHVWSPSLKWPDV